MKRAMPGIFAAGLVACDAFWGVDGNGAADPAGSADGGAADGASQAEAGAGLPTGAALDLATGQSTPSAIVLDGANVTWLNRPTAGKKGEVVRVPKAGGSPPEVLTRDLVDPVAITLDTTSVFVAENDVGPGYGFQVIYKQDKQGGSASRKQLTANDRLLGSLVHGRSVIWAMEGGGGSVGLVDVDPWATSSTTALAGELGAIKALAADGRYVYAGGAGQITRVSRSGEPTIPFASTRGAVASMVLDGATSRLYWADASSIRFLDAASPGGAPTDLATNEDPPAAIAVDATNIYWTDFVGGRIRTVPKAGGVVSTLASGEGEPLGIAVDATGLYWTNRADGRVRVLRR